MAISVTFEKFQVLTGVNMKITSSGMWGRIVWWKFTNFFFLILYLTFLSWRWRDDIFSELEVMESQPRRHESLRVLLFVYVFTFIIEDVFGCNEFSDNNDYRYNRVHILLLLSCTNNGEYIRKQINRKRKTLTAIYFLI